MIKDILNAVKQRGYEAILLASIGFMAIGCSKGAQVVETSQGAASRSVYTAFAGGGWRAHSGHTGWISSATDQAKSVDAAFGSVNTISSNSGGSWFSTMLFYSPKFHASLDSGNSALWLTEQESKYKNHTACHKSGEATGCILLADYGRDWHDFIAGFVVDGTWIDPNRLLNSPDVWAQNKSLLLAGTLLTRNVVLDGQIGHDKRFNWLCPRLSTPSLKGGWIGRKDGFRGGVCSPQLIEDVIPVTFSHLAAGGSGEFLKGRSTEYHLGYSKTFLSGAPLEAITVSNPLNSSGVKVINAASASSAAAGFTASEHVSGHWDESYELRNLGVSFSLSSKGVQQMAIPAAFTDLKKQKIVRIADGGVVDNTGVAQLVSDLQKRRISGPYDIVAFDNYAHPYGANGLSNGFEYLLGLKSANHQVSFFGYDVKIPNLNIFDKPAVMPTPVRSVLNMPNCPKASTINDALYYHKFTVQTRNNPALGVAKGTSVNLHVFTSASSAPTEPADVDKAFDCYKDLLAGIKTDKIIKTHIKNALNLP